MSKLTILQGFIATGRTGAKSEMFDPPPPPIFKYHSFDSFWANTTERGGTADFNILHCFMGFNKCSYGFVVYAN